MKTLAGRRILFIGTGFYDYERSIVDRLIALGSQVAVFESPPRMVGKGPWAGLLQRLPWVSNRLVRLHERAILDRVNGSDYDQVLIIKSTNLAFEFVKTLRAMLPRTELILYLWDSMARLPGIEQRLPLFDRVLTFDRQDAELNARLQFRPLFFRESAAANDAADSPTDIDISFVGWLHSDRLQAVRDIEASARASGLSTYVYLYTGLATWARLALRGQARGVHVRPMSYRTLMSINRRSRCVLDLPHGSQSGLTMRAIEALGSGNKLATSGADIANYDFYAPSNVALINAQQPRIDPSFVSSPKSPVPDTARRRYTLDAWIGDVFGTLSGTSLHPRAAPQSPPPKQSVITGQGSTMHCSVYEQLPFNSPNCQRAAIASQPSLGSDAEGEHALLHPARSARRAMFKPLLKKLIFLRAMGLRYSWWRAGVVIAPPRIQFARHLGACHGTGLEIGGPSAVFKAGGLFPAYESAERVDNVTFAAKTRWEGDVTAGQTFVFHPKKAPGTQFVSEGGGLSMLPGASYDFILSCHMLEHTANPLRALHEWKRLLKPGGSLLLVLPHRDGSFDHRRPVTSLAHLADDFDGERGEDDTTHLEEILALHDLSRDPLQASRADFEQWIRANETNRGAHHHVFDIALSVQILTQTGYQVRDVQATMPCHIFLLATKLCADQALSNERLPYGAAAARQRSPFPSDRVRGPVV